MQKTLEVLKSEGGLTICKLSEKKWLFKYKMPVRTECGEVLFNINSKARYRIDEEKDVYLPLNDYRKLCRIVSMKTGVSMDKIASYGIERERHLGKNFNLTKGFIILDKSWIRDFKIKKMINEINNN